MSTMVERVERAMVSHLLKEETDAGNYVENDAENPRSVCLDGYFDLKALARAAIEAMMEPTEEMLNAPYEAEIDFGPGGSGDIEASPDNVWRAMIQAALKESE